TTNTLMISAPSASVPTSIDPNTNASWNAAVPSAWILAGTQVLATVDPSNLISESDKTNNQFSENLDVRTLHQWKVTLLPIKTTDNRTGVVESGSFTKTNWVDFAKRLHPVPDNIDVVVAPTFTSSVQKSNSSDPGVLLSDGTHWGNVLSEISAKRTADGSSASDRYYFGVVKVSYNSGVAGLGYVGAPAAMGWDYTSDAADVFAHEEGHNFNRPHSPCGGADQPDKNYPYTIAKGYPADGIIGVPGWDVFASSNNLKNQNTYTDIMGYCNTQWISDYVYLSELNYRATKSFDVVSADVVGDSDQQDALLVWGRIEDGVVTLEPAFKVKATGVAPDAGPYLWQAKDATGQVLMSLPFDAPEVADIPNKTVRIFSFVVPMSSDTMNRILTVALSRDGHELTRKTASVPLTSMVSARAVVKPEFLPNHKMQLTWDASQSPLVMLRDAKTGEVRGFSRGGSATIDDAPDDLEVQFSDGIHSNAVEYQRPIQ
ncbi:MAG TPA: M66 family metalloprotease, partial [Terriglobales bacterium]|nr:M66 family metalloprotease [Terriglobales bacterium]